MTGLVFQTTDTNFQTRNGEPVKLIDMIAEPDDTHDAEVLPMFVIEFPDGTVLEAFPDELQETGE